MSETETVKLYGGRVTLDFHHGTHRYYVSGTRADGTAYNPKSNADGVTTIGSGIINKGEYLGNWIGRTDVDHVRKGWLKAREAGELDPTAFLALCDEAETAHLRARDGAGDVGSIVHGMIEKFITGETYETPDNVDVQRAFKAFLSWKEQTDIEITQVERYVFSEKYFYAGRSDFLGNRRGRKIVGDFKTGSAFYEDQAYQLTGYACAIEEEMGYSIPDGLIIQLDKATGRFTEYHVDIDEAMKDAWYKGVIHYKNLKRIKKMVRAINDDKRGRKGS